ncbi:MAG: beta-N-acetylhexosaminidase [Gammaproteobacteria bacterium]
MYAPLGSLMFDLQGPELLPGERDLLAHPAAGGVILFTRNYTSREQLARLVAEIHAVRDPPLLVAVDHEGGRVQRFRPGFTALPPCAVLGRHHDKDPQRAQAMSRECGWLMAFELRTLGVDFSFAPVLDLGNGVSEVIGDRAFHPNPRTVIRLAEAYLDGMHEAGMAGVGKHFPGHGSVAADSHCEIPVDSRSFEAIRSADLLPFAGLVRAGLDAVMPAHVIYPEVDTAPAGFSAVWLRQVLRKDLGFEGAIFSDDIDMAGARGAGTHSERAQLALAAGCDMVLMCNRPRALPVVLDALSGLPEPSAEARLARMRGRALASERLLEERRCAARAGVAALPNEGAAGYR